MMDFRKQKRSINIVLTLTYVVLFARLIPIRFAIGERGVGVFSTVFLLFASYEIFLYEIFARVLGKALSARLKKEQYRNADSLMSFSFATSLLFSIIIAFILLFASKGIVLSLTGYAAAQKVFQFLLPAYVFASLSAVLSAYYKSYGEEVNDSLIRLLTEILGTLFAIMLSGGFYKHGQKVGAILKTNTYSGIYGAQGCALGITIGALFGLLIYFFVVIQLRVSMKRLVNRDSMTNTDNAVVYTRVLINKPFLYYVSTFIMVLLPVLDGKIMKSAIDKLSPEAIASKNIAIDSMTQFGILSTQVLWILLIGIMLIVFTNRDISISVRKANLQDERQTMKEILSTRLRRYFMIGAPICAFLIVFAVPLMSFFTKGDAQSVKSAFRLNIFGLFFFGAGIVLLQFLVGLEKKMYIFVIDIVTFAVHLIFMAIFAKTANSPTTAFGIATFVSGIIFCVTYGFVVSMQLNYAYKLYVYAKPLVCASFAALGGFAVAAAGKSAPLFIIILLGMAIYFVLYVLLMIVLRGFSRKEMNVIPGANLIRSLIYGDRN